MRIAFELIRLEGVEGFIDKVIEPNKKAHEK
jgi:hypothetical protein